MFILDNQRGVALVIVLWVTVLLTVMAGGFISIIRVEARGVANYKDESQAYFLARSGVNIAIEELLSRNTNDRRNKGAANEERWVWDGSLNRMSIGNDGFVEIKVSDESGKVDLNEADSMLLKRLLIGLEIKETDRNIIVASILDWIDENNFHRLNGAEDDYYRSLSEPYEASDGPMSIIEELLWVKGVTPELFYGRGSEVVVGLDPEEEPEEKAGLIALFTVLTGKARVNVNTAPFEVLLSIPGVDEESAERIIEARKKRDFASVNDLTALGVRLAPDIGKSIAFTSDGFYTVEATGGLEGSPVRYSIKAVVKISEGARHKIVYWKDQETMGKISYE